MSEATITPQLCQQKAEECWKHYLKQFIDQPNIDKDNFIRIYTAAYFQGAKDTQAAIIANFGRT